MKAKKIKLLEEKLTPQIKRKGRLERESAHNMETVKVKLELDRKREDLVSGVCSSLQKGGTNGVLYSLSICDLFYIGSLTENDFTVRKSFFTGLKPGGVQYMNIILHLIHPVS